MQRIPISIIIFYCLACTPNKRCKIDQDFVDRFNACIELIELSEMSKLDHEIEPKINAILFLNAVSGYESQITDIHFPSYERRDLLYDDIGKWRKWLGNNKCTMTMERADSLLGTYNNGSLR